MERGTPITFDALEKGSILFLTNNTNTDGLYRWLKEQGEQVYRVENKVTAQMIAQMKPSLMISFNYRHMIPQEVLELMPGRVIFIPRICPITAALVRTFSVSWRIRPRV